MNDRIAKKDKYTPGQMFFVAGILLINLTLWVIPSDIVELVARDRHTLLGHYSRRHFIWIIAVFIISVILLHLHFSANKQIKKKRLFRITAIVLSLTATFLIADIVLRLTKTWRYEMESLAYHRTPDTQVQEVFTDAPKAARTYPRAPPGYGTVKCTLTVDHRGFRNPHAESQSPVVVLGDSFAEGSSVSDDDTWPRLFAKKSGEVTVNLGMSGYAPQHYRASLLEYGLKLKPRFVFCLLYEGNDFRSAKVTLKAPAEWKRFFKRSPILSVIDHLMIKTLGPIGSHRKQPELDKLSWLPIAFPPRPKANYYTFGPDRLAKHYISRKDFVADRRWERTRTNLQAIGKLCEGIHAELILVYAPSKPHVILPLVRSSLPAEKVRSFVAMKAKDPLPSAKIFMKNLFEYLDCKEEITREWCKEQGVSFLSLTRPLRDAVRRGEQAYYTYDQHWSPEGHRIVAESVYHFWSVRQGISVEPLKKAATLGSEDSIGD